MVVWYRRKPVLVRLLYVVTYLSLPVGAAVKLGISWTTVGTVALLIGQRGWSAWKELEPQHMQFLKKNYLQRKYALGGMIEQMHRMGSMKDEEVQRFRSDTLQLIANYVRDHRADVSDPRIYANLLIEDGDDLVVIARDQPNGRLGVRYRKSKMAVAEVLHTGEAVIIGDLSSEFPSNADGKSYKSILGLPIYLDGRIAAILSIDSQQAYHFDWEASELWDYLLPYMNLLAWTVEEKRVIGLRVKWGRT
jgi:GAF domain-containing protein